MLSANLCVLLSSLLEPFMPSTSSEIARQLDYPRAQIPANFGRFLPADHAVKEAVPLFKKISDEEVTSYRAQFAGKER